MGLENWSFPYFKRFSHVFILAVKKGIFNVVCEFGRDLLTRRFLRIFQNVRKNSGSSAAILKISRF